MSDKDQKKQKRKAGQEKRPDEKIVLPNEEFEALNEKAKKCDEYHDKMLRAFAELDNTKKRLFKEKEEFLKFANEELILRLLPIVDNFDRALASVKHTKETDAVLNGIRLVQKEFHSLFKDHGVEAIESVGKKFDPHLHEAIAVVESDECPEDTVVEEVQRGYTLKGRLVRPSIVKVSKDTKKGKD
jgi:molecular chaperone GrpE